MTTYTINGAMTIDEPLVLADGDLLVGNDPIRDRVKRGDDLEPAVVVKGRWARIKGVRVDNGTVVEGDWSKVSRAVFRGRDALTYQGPSYNHLVSLCDLHGVERSLVCLKTANEIAVLSGRVRVQKVGIELVESSGLKLYGLNLAGLSTSNSGVAVRLSDKRCLVKSFGSRFEGHPDAALVAAFDLAERAVLYSGGDSISRTSVKDAFMGLAKAYVTHLPARAQEMLISCQGLSIVNGTDWRNLLSVERLGKYGQLGKRILEAF